jgi:hypothetical protein
MELRSIGFLEVAMVRVSLTRYLESIANDDREINKIRVNLVLASGFFPRVVATSFIAIAAGLHVAPSATMILGLVQK